MKALKMVRRALWEVFDFFCGDWYNLIGLVVTVLALVAIDRVQVLSPLMPVRFVLYPVLVVLTLALALRRASRKKTG